MDASHGRTSREAAVSRRRLIGVADASRGLARDFTAESMKLRIVALGHRLPSWIAEAYAELVVWRSAWNTTAS